MGKKSKKSIWLKKSHIAEKHKKRPLRLIKRFLQTEIFKKFKGYPLKEFKNFPKKVA